MEKPHQGTIANATTKHISWPRIMLIYFGHRQVTSAAKGMKLQAIEVPNVANANATEAKKTPALDLDVYVWSKIPLSRS